MTAHRILYLNAFSTAGCAAGLLAARGLLYPLFGLESPLLLDVVAVGLALYAGALAYAARRETIARETLMAFTIADALWVAASALVLVLFWGQLAPLARLLIVAVALVVEVFAGLQYRAAGSSTRGLEAA